MCDSLFAHRPLINNNYAAGLRPTGNVFASTGNWMFLR